MARYLAVLIYRLLTQGEAWVDRGAAQFERKRLERDLDRSVREGESQRLRPGPDRGSSLNRPWPRNPHAVPDEKQPKCAPACQKMALPSLLLTRRLTTTPPRNQTSHQLDRQFLESRSAFSGVVPRLRQ